MLIILHGWSDNARSFNRLGKTLVDNGVASSVTHVRLGDYVSMDDYVTFDDLANALQSAWETEKIPTRARSVDAVVHSTGGLVIRHWMTKFHTPQSNPIHRLLMLAPANFGSPLAHKGRSFIGRIFKGYASDRPFETGTQILKGLELGSPFAWALAERDRFSKDAWYGPGRVLCTVMVGTSGYSGISAAANEDGSDGTVRVSTANLNCARIRLDFCTDPQKPTFELTPSNGATAFARVAGKTTARSRSSPAAPRTTTRCPLITEALKLTDAQFPAWVERLETYSALAREQTRDDDDAFAHGYQNTVVRLTDNFGAFVPDYFLEVFAKNSDGSVNNALTAHVQEKVVNTVHAYEDNPAFRSLLLNSFELEDAFSAKGHPVYVCVTANPDVRQTATVGYSTFGYNDLESIRLEPDESRGIFQPDRTLLADLVIKRQQLEKVFRLVPLS